MTKQMWRVVILLAALAALSCGGGESIKVGAVLPLSGDEDVYGVSVRRGMLLAHEEIRKSRGINLELVIEDSKSDPDVAATRLAELHAQGVVAAIAGTTNREAARVVTDAHIWNGSLIVPAATELPEDTAGYVYRMFPTAAREATALASYATQGLKLTRVVAVTHERQSREYADAFKAQFTGHEGATFEYVWYELADTLEQTAMDAMEKSPQAVLLPPYLEDISTFAGAFRKAGYKGYIFVTSLAAHPRISLGGDPRNLLYAGPNFSTENEDPAFQLFRANYITQFEEEPDVYAAHGYDALMAIANALPSGEAVTRDSVLKGMRFLEGFDGITGAIQFDEKCHAQKFPRVYGIVEDDGEIKLVDHRKWVEDKRAELNRRLEELQRQQRAREGG